MAAKHTIAYFLEDFGHEAIIPPLVRRLIKESGKTQEAFEHKTLYSRGGGSVAEVGFHDVGGPQNEICDYYDIDGGILNK